MPSMTVFLYGLATVRIAASPPWHGALQRRLAPWLHPAEEADWRISIVADDTLSIPHGPFCRARPQFRGGICYLADSARRGRIDVARREARLRAHPLVGASDVRYFLRTVMAVVLFQSGALLVHAAGVVCRGKAILFAGRSGSGKTTIASLAGERPILHDDLVCLLSAGGGWRVAPLPGEATMKVKPVPLSGILLLGKGAVNWVESVPAGTLVAELAANSPVVNVEPAHWPALLALWRVLLRNTPAGRLYFRPDETLWEAVDGWLG